MTTSELELQTAKIGGKALLVRFRRIGDRYRHEIWLEGDGADSVEVFRSVEGDGTDLWPPSGVLQELLPGGENDSIAGLGMAGKSHWSVAVLATKNDPQDPSMVGLDFDFACRVKEPPAFLGTRYSIQEEISPHSSHAPSWRAKEIPGDLACTCAGSEATVTVDSQAGLVIAPSLEQSNELPHTFRWRYHFTYKV